MQTYDFTNCGKDDNRCAKKKKPPTGLVQILNVTEKQFSKMEYLVGEFHSEIIDSDERLIVL